VKLVKHDDSFNAIGGHTKSYWPHTPDAARSMPMLEKNAEKFIFLYEKTIEIRWNHNAVMTIGNV
jgi:hypothetical protein